MFVPVYDYLDMFKHIESQRKDGLSADSVAGVFQQLDLPEPRGKEYRITSDFGYLILMTPLGCTVRITSNERCPPIKHHRILKPLVRFDLGTHRVDINPGLKLTKSLASAMRMSSALFKDKIMFEDSSARNCAIIPAKCTGSLFNYTVVCDDGAYKATSWECGLVSKIIHRLVAANDNKNNNIQERAYKHLREAFARALETGERDDIRAAWGLCHQKKNEGYLRSDWENPPDKTPISIKHISQRYAPRLQHLTA